MALKSIEKLLLYLNIMTMVFLAVCIRITTQNIILTGRSTEFINSVDAIASNSLSLVLWVVGCGVFLILLEYHIKVPSTKVVILEALLIVFLVHKLGYNYNGIILFIVVKVLSMETDKPSIKYIFLTFGVAIFIVTSQDLVLSYFSYFLFENYMSFYNALWQQILITTYTVLEAVNIVVFILYCAIYMRGQQEKLLEINMLYQELNETNQKLSDMNFQLIKYADEREHYGQINERNRVAREIHDTLGHLLTGLTYGLEACVNTIDVSISQTKTQISSLLDISRKGVHEVRRSVNALREDNGNMDDLTLVLTTLIKDAKKISNMEIIHSIQIDNHDFSEDEALTIYRIVQESITNCLRHANAKNMYIQIKRKQDSVEILVQDDGIGCTNMKKGFGTLHIVERVHMLNGQVTYDGENGFKIHVTIPLRQGGTS